MYLTFWGFFGSICYLSRFFLVQMLGGGRWYNLGFLSTKGGGVVQNRRNHHSNCNSSCVREDMLWTI